MAERAGRFALVAHDAEKGKLAAWARSRRGALSRHRLRATGFCAGQVMEACPGPRIEELLGGPKAGDPQVGPASLRASGHPRLPPDPDNPHPHQGNLQAHITISLLADIPVAPNRTSADHLEPV